MPSFQTSIKLLLILLIGLYSTLGNGQPTTNYFPNYYIKALHEIDSIQLNNNPNKAIYLLNNLENSIPTDSVEEYYDIKSQILFLKYSAYDLLSDRKKALTYALKYENHINTKTRKEPKKHYIALGILSREYMYQGYLKEAEKELNRTWDIIQGFTSPFKEQCIGLYYQSLADIYLAKKDAIKEFQALKRSEQSFLSLPKDYAYYDDSNISIQFRLIDFYINTDSLDLALKHLKKASSYKSNYINQGYLHLFNGIIFFKKNDFKAAIQYEKKALHIFDSLHIESALLSTSESLSKSYRAIGDSINATKYEIDYLQIANNINQNNEEVRFILHEKIASKHEPSTKNIIIIGSVILTLLLILGTLIYTTYKLKNKITYKNKVTTEKKETERIETELITLAQKDPNKFLESFKIIHPHFLTKLKKETPELTKNELFYCALVKMNFSNKEIAQMTYVTIKAIEVKRYRINKKLNLPKQQRLTEYIKSL